jgi:hypothetical protein
MAQIIDSDTGPQPISSAYDFVGIFIIGVILGLAYWFLATGFEKYFSSLELAGNVSTILVATLGIIIMAARRMSQPTMIGSAAGVSLYGLAVWVNGLSSAEEIIWIIGLYVLSYVLFSWISRYIRVIPVVVSVLTVVVLARIAAAL